MGHAPKMSMGELRRALPVFPAAMSTLTQPTTGPSRWHPSRVTAAVLCFAAFVLVLVSSFLPLYSGELTIGAQTVAVTVSPWSADVSGAPDTVEVPWVGYPLAFGAIVLACAAAGLAHAATPAASPGAGRLATGGTIAGAAFLTGTVWTTALLVINNVDSIVRMGSLGQGLQTDASYLAGHWLLVVAALLGLVAAVLAIVPVRRPAWPPPEAANPYAATPPYGTALPASAPPRHHHVDQRTGGLIRVDPLTGQPLQSPPSGVPAQRFPTSPPGGVPTQPSPASPPGGPPSPSAAPGPYERPQGPPPAAPPLPATDVDPRTGQPLPPAPYEAPQTAAAAVNGTQVPVATPDAPQTPPGPAVPPSEDPLAEPPRT